MAGLFGAKKPQPTPAAPMPDDQAPQVLEAKRRATEQAMARAGRASTILSSGNGGSGSYGGSKLGGAG